MISLLLSVVVFLLFIVINPANVLIVLFDKLSSTSLALYIYIYIYICSVVLFCSPNNFFVCVNSVCYWIGHNGDTIFSRTEILPRHIYGSSGLHSLFSIRTNIFLWILYLFDRYKST